jgi:hypothetical protein
MPSFEHEAILRLFRNDPQMASRLLSDALGAELPTGCTAQVYSEAMTQLQPVPYAADLVLLHYRPGESAPAYGLIVEMQRDWSDDKRFTWPYYAISLYAERRCPVYVLVITRSPTVARNASEPIAVGMHGVLQVDVLHTSQVPIVLDPADARSSPELAILSAFAHGPSECGRAVTHAAYAAAVGLESGNSLLYSELIILLLSSVAKHVLEGLVDLSNYEFQSEFAIEHIAKREAKAKAQAKAEGKAEGEAKGKAEAILAVLASRGVMVTTEQRELCLECHDLAQLDAWLARAATATLVTDVFEPTK